MDYEIQYSPRRKTEKKKLLATYYIINGDLHLKRLIFLTQIEIESKLCFASHDVPLRNRINSNFEFSKELCIVTTEITIFYLSILVTNIDLNVSLYLLKQFWFTLGQIRLSWVRLGYYFTPNFELSVELWHLTINHHVEVKHNNIKHQPKSNLFI